MRSLEECKAEVYRRGAKRLRLRRGMLQCVPVILAVSAVLTLLLTVPEKNTGSSLNGVANEMAPQTASMTLQVCRGEQCRDITDPEQIGTLYRMLTEMETMGSAGSTLNPPEDSSGVNQTPNYESPSVTVLVFYDPAGGQTYTYRLTEEGCCRVETGENVELTPQQRQELEGLL